MDKKSAPSKQVRKVPIRKTVMVLLIIVLVLLLDKFFTGFMSLGYNIVRCGRMPVATSSSPFWGGSYVYMLPGHYQIGHVQDGYVCTEQEAIARGAVKSLYDR